MLEVWVLRLPLGELRFALTAGASARGVSLSLPSLLSRLRGQVCLSLPLGLVEPTTPAGSSRPEANYVFPPSACRERATPAQSGLWSSQPPGLILCPPGDALVCVWIRIQLKTQKSRAEI